MTNRRMYELIENAPKTGRSPTIWAWPQLTEYLKTAAQPVAGPWPPHQEPRPDPTDEDLPVAVPDPHPHRPTGPQAAPPRSDMYPSRFRYAAPRSLDEAIALLAEHGDDAKVLAGGQSLVPLLKLRFAAPALLVDINNLPGLDHHREDDDGTLRIGALCRHVHLERSALLPGRHPLMASAAPLVADPIVRNRGTLVGSRVPRRPAGRLGVGHDRARRLDRGAGPGGAAHDPRGPTSWPARSRTRCDPARSPSRPSSPPRRAPRRAPTSSWSGGSATSRRPGSRWRWSRAAATVTRAGIALTGVGPATIHAAEAEKCWSGSRSPRTRSTGRRGCRGRRRPAADRPPRQRGLQTPCRGDVRAPRVDQRAGRGGVDHANHVTGPA